MLDWKEYYKSKTISLDDFGKLIKNGDTIATGLATSAVTPAFHDAIIARSEELENVTWADALGLRPSKFYDVEFMSKLKGRINHKSFFNFNTTRKLSAANLSDFVPCCGYTVHKVIANNCSVYAVMVTPPNEQGYVNLGLTNFYNYELITKGKQIGTVKTVVAEVNDQMPKVYGNNWVHISQFDYFVENSSPIPAAGRPKPSEIDKAIGNYCLEMINDGDCIQMGLGTIPEAVIAGLDGKKDLGVNSEMLPGGIQDLVAKGIVTNERKVTHKGKSVAAFALGDKAMYDFVTENPAVEFYPMAYTNGADLLSREPNMVTMNMGLLIDLSGQVVSEGLGHRQISGTGGQLDFNIGADLSPGGRGLTLVYSSRKLSDGSLGSAIVPEFPAGSPITVPRTFVDYVVTEYGVVRLKYLSRRERAKALISIAHPDFRADLKKAADKAFGE